MSAVPGLAPRAARALASRPADAVPRLALLGTGNVGSAFVARCERLRARGVAVPVIGWLCNSRAAAAGGARPLQVLEAVRGAASAGDVGVAWNGDRLRPGDMVVDATASDAVAARHPEWLARGIHVATANKLGPGAGSARARAIIEAQREGGAHYGDAATVGAGLPLLRSIRGLVAGGDRIRAVEGVLSGSLAWLFDRYDGSRPFSALVREARDNGYTEPDPRQDLSGEDVRRKLLILARASGLLLEARDIRVSSLVPDALRDAPADAVDAQLNALDAPLRERFLTAYRSDARLCFVGRFDAGRGASVGLRALPMSNPLAGGYGTENRAAIFSDRYPERPLVIQGPGAGAQVTAAALLDDVLRIARTAAGS